MAAPALTARIAFATTDPFSVTPVWTDVSADLIEVTITRGRQRELDRCDTGVASVRFENASWQYLPGYTSARYSPYVLPGRRIQITCTVAGTLYSLFDGYIERWEVDWSQPDMSTVVVGASDALALFQKAQLVGAFPQQTTSARIAAILNTLGWPTSRTIIRYGGLVCPAKTWVTTDNMGAGSALSQTADTEPGTFFCDGSGTATFYPAFVGGAMPAALGDRPDLGEIDIGQATLALSLDAVANVIHGQRDGAPQSAGVTVTSSSSKAEFQTLQSTKQTFNVNDTGLMETLNAFLAHYQYPTQLFDPVVLEPVGDLNSAFAFCCLAEIGKSVQFNRTPSPATGLPRFQQQCVINWLQHDLKPGTQDWTTSLRLAGAALH